ncbi:DUF255 domain-containing protein [Shewanella waksmanii]|uniref:DUF255 domain-containing protein n=1 Tax=Shewanella waksmanii TaxID=213783 RepID=UPI00373531AC
MFAIMSLQACNVYAQANGAQSSDEQAKRIVAYNGLKDWLVEQQVISSSVIEPQYLNALIHANSPYLISHALQPIDWYEWRQQYNQGSGDSSKLLFVSIGYSTCHWCHVMAEESFNDPTVAELLNESYISVKVDREQWPLVDNRFKSALEAIKGEAGWPINAILTPDGQLIWIESYLDKQAFSKVLVGLAKRWQSKPSAVNALAKRVEQKLLLDKPPVIKGNSVTLSNKQWRQALPSLHEDIASGLQKEQGSDGPRFFRAYWLLGLLDEYMRSSDITLLRQVQNHVDSILKSPTYDAVEGGFHRYAVDGQWQVPHYEKMLYTQANMIRVLAKLYAITGQQRYRIAIMQTVDWGERWLKQTQGMGSAVSALSDGIEGRYYQQLANERSQIDFSKDWSRSTIVEQLAESRESRVKPLVDEKVILSWNSLYIVALLEAYQVTRQAEFLQSATELSNQLWQSLVERDTVYRSLFAERVAINAELEDLAWFAQSQMMLSFYATNTDKDSSQNMNRVLSAYARSEFLLEKMISVLSDADSLQELINLNRDGELPSARGVVFGALTQGYGIIPNRQYRQYAKAVSPLNGQWQTQLVNEYAFISYMADSLNPIAINQTTFAKGNGKVQISRDSFGVSLHFDMADDWHVNANQITNSRLIATEVKFSSGQAKVEYPQFVEKHLEFDTSTLLLYEDQFVISAQLDDINATDLIVSVTVQACSQTLCLLPETLQIYVQ